MKRNLCAVFLLVSLSSVVPHSTHATTPVPPSRAMKDVLGVIHSTPRYTMDGGLFTTGTWSVSTASPNYYGVQYLHDGNTQKGLKSFRFNPYLPADGTYEVFVRWTSSSNRASNVPVQIVTATGTVSCQVDQRSNGGLWFSLGVYSFNRGNGGNVQISNTGTNGFVVVDAVRFVRTQTQEEIIMDDADLPGSALDSLNEGIGQIAALGSGAAKLWLNQNVQNAYPDFYHADADASKHHPWPAPSPTNPKGGYNSPLEVVQLPYYAKALSDPDMKTYSLETFLFTNASNPNPVNWLYTGGITVNGKQTALTQAQYNSAYSQIYDLATYLLNTYDGTGKTFIIQNWEADGDLHAVMFKYTYPPDSTADVINARLLAAREDAGTQGMKVYMEQRQKAVQDARTNWQAAHPNNNSVQVYNAFEISCLPTSPDFHRGVSNSNPNGYDFPLLIDALVPMMGQCDLYSYSCWQSIYVNTSPQILYQINYMRSNVPTLGILGKDNIFAGEFGSYEDMWFPAVYQTDKNKLHHTAGYQGSSDSVFSSVIAQQIEYLLRANVRHLFFWNLYAGGTRLDAAKPTSPAMPSDAAFCANPYNMTEEYMRGTWLIRPPGYLPGVSNYQGPVSTPASSYAYSYTGAYDFLASQMGKNLYYDELSNTGYLASHTPDLAIATGTQTWAESDNSRLYPSTSGVQNAVYYATQAPDAPNPSEGICDWSIKVFLFTNATQPGTAGKLRGYLSPDGVTWSPAFNFAESDLCRPDPNQPWYRVYLRPPTTLPTGFQTGQKYLKIEWCGHELANYDTQIGSVQIITDQQN